jgi:hypothetical protein
MFGSAVGAAAGGFAALAATLNEGTGKHFAQSGEAADQPAAGFEFGVTGHGWEPSYRIDWHYYDCQNNPAGIRCGLLCPARTGDCYATRSGFAKSLRSRVPESEQR